MSRLAPLIEDLSAGRRDATSAAHKKRWGQFFTPARLALRMAAMAHAPRHPLRILDPGAGTGMLGLVASESLLARGVPAVELVCMESEAGALGALHAAVDHARKLLGPGFRAEVMDRDVLTSSAAEVGTFDLVIANPPYFKMSPKHPTGSDAPNAYARFMDVAKDLLRDGGELVFLVPRSFTSGAYYQRFRRRFHAGLSLARVHVFGRRDRAFQRDHVLQETVVVSYRRAPLTGPVTIHQSLGLDDLLHASTVRAPRELVVHDPDHDCIISLPTTEEDVALLHDMRGQPTRLQDLGLSVSTGPVVPFRTDALVAPGPSAAPLLWLQHVTDQITWPLKDFSKPQGICLDADAKLLLPNETYVVLRRFSAKGDARRITAAVYEEGQLPGPWLGLENHLNYVHAHGRGLPLELAHGLATYLTTDAVERYFAVSSGNTQVSAAELRALPLPTEAVLRAHGRARLARHAPQTPVMHTATKT